MSDVSDTADEMSRSNMRSKKLRDAVVDMFNAYCEESGDFVTTGHVADVINGLNKVKNNLVNSGMYQVASEIRNAAALLREFQRDVEREEEITDA